MELKELLENIKNNLLELKNKYPKVDFEIGLNEGAKEEDFEELEKIIGYELPEDFKELYRIHNGSSSHNFLCGEEWLSIDRIIDEFNIRNNLHKNGDFRDDDGNEYGNEGETGIDRTYWWNPKWLPFTADGAGNGLMIDYSPTSEGTFGQIISMDHETGDRAIYAKSLKEYFTVFGEDLYYGDYVLDEDYGLILERDL